MKIKLIASDMDGTLLDDDYQLSQFNAEAIKKAEEQGVIFTIATGRMYCSILPFAEQLALDVPLIAYNGALVKEAVSGKVIFDLPVPHAEALAVLDYCKQRGYYIQAYVDDTLLVKENCGLSNRYATFAGVEYKAIGSSLYELSKAPHKLLIMTGPEKHDSIRDELKTEFGDKIMLTNSYNNFLEVVNPAVNKWRAVEALAVSRGIDPVATMCIGDSNNDYEMIVGAGVGVAMANANERIRGAAQMITASNNENGVGLAIEAALRC